MSVAIDNPVQRRRPRRRTLTPVTGGLAAIIVAAGGFIGGVQLQKSQGTTSAPGGGQVPTGLAQGGGPPGAAGTSDAATTGTVEYTKGNVLYVKDADGTTIKVKLKSSSEVTRTASTDASAIHAGDQVVVQGETASSGTVTATAVTATE
jgi:hypothetical protein